MSEDKDQAMLEALKRGADFFREAVQLALPADAKPEYAVRLVRSLMTRAVIPRVAAQEYARLGGSDADLFKQSLDTPNLGHAIQSLLGWAWIMDVGDRDGTTMTVAFNREQATEIHRRLSKALHE